MRGLTDRELYWLRAAAGPLEDQESSYEEYAYHEHLEKRGLLRRYPCPPPPNQEDSTWFAFEPTAMGNLLLRLALITNVGVK